MAYFPNGTSGMYYEEQYCIRCVHDSEERGCPIMLAHNLYNYRDCNDDNSILHLLIPREGIDNLECTMFWPKDEKADAERRAGSAIDDKYRAWLAQRNHAKAP